jgi:hypothetical protein
MVVADPNEALIEAIAEAIAESLNDEMEKSDPNWQHTIATQAKDWTDEARAAYAAMTEHLGLVEEWSVRHAQGIHPGPFTEEGARHWIAQDIKNDERRRWEARGKQRLLRRLVQSRWVEVDHGSE